MKLCRKCEQLKEETEFALRGAGKRRNDECKKCYNATAKRRYRSSPEQLQKNRADAKAYRDAHPDLYRDSKLRTTFGIGLSDYNDMLSQQNGRCAICKRLPGKRRLGVDHDHKTGKVRGLLCGPCNVILGFVDDNPEALLDAMFYLYIHAAAQKAAAS